MHVARSTTSWHRRDAPRLARVLRRSRAGTADARAANFERALRRDGARRSWRSYRRSRRAAAGIRVPVGFVHGSRSPMPLAASTDGADRFRARGLRSSKAPGISSGSGARPPFARRFDVSPQTSGAIPGLRVAFVVARKTVVRELIPRRARCNEGGETGAVLRWSASSEPRRIATSSPSGPPRRRGWSRRPNKRLLRVRRPA